MKFFTKIVFIIILLFLNIISYNTRYLGKAKFNLSNNSSSIRKNKYIQNNSPNSSSKDNSININQSSASNNEVIGILNNVMGSNPYVSAGMLAVQLISKNMDQMKKERDRFNKEWKQRQDNRRSELKKLFDLNRQEAFNQMILNMDVKDESLMTEENLIPLVKQYIKPDEKKQDATTIENGNWLGIGYNIALSNPILPTTTGQLMDQGFASRIFEVKYDDNFKTYDNYYIIPKGFEIEPAEICQASFSSQIIRSFTELTNVSKTSLNGEISLPFYFGASNYEINNIRNSMEGEGKALIKNQANCSIYRAIINFYDPPKLTTNFLKGLSILNNNPFIDLKDDKKIKIYLKFINNFGTHYIDNVLMGSKFVYIEEISNSDLNDINYNGSNMGMQFQHNEIINSLNIEGNISNDNNKDNSYKNKVSKIYSMSIGAPFSPDMKIERWMISTKLLPQPISYSINDLTNLLKNTKINQQVKEFDSKINLGNIISSLKLFLSEKTFCEILKLNNNVGCPGIPTSNLDILKITDEFSRYKFDHLSLECDKNQGLNQFYLTTAEFDNVIFNYKCLESNKITNDCLIITKKTSDNTILDFYQFFTLQNIICPYKSVIRSFNWEKDGGEYKLNYNCCTTTPFKVNLEVQNKISDIGKYWKPINAYADEADKIQFTNAFNSLRFENQIKEFKVIYKTIQLKEKNNNKKK